jgi:tetratricopeptide (TPR) repeat protein
VAKKVSASAKTPKKSPAISSVGQQGARSGRRWGWALLLLSCAALAGAAGWWLRHPDPAERMQARLPARPDLTGKPAVLVDLLAKAQAGTASPGDALDKITELGRLYHANGFYPEAAACWRLLQTEQPGVARWDYYLADLERIASNYPAMSTLLIRTTELAPDYSPAWLLLAGLQFKTGQLENAERNYQKRLQLLPGDPYARLWLTRVALQKGQQTEARSLIEQLLKDSPDFSSAHNLYGEMLAAAGDTAGASRHRWLGREAGRFREADDPWLDELRAWCYDFDRLCAQGAIEYQTGQANLAKSYYERAIKLRPEAATGYELLGSLYLKLKDPNKARDMLEQCLPKLKNSKPSLSYYLSLCQAYQELKREDETVRVAQEGLRQLGDNLELYSFLGTALGDLGRSDEAIVAFQRALAISANAPNPNYNLGLLLLKLGRRDEAVVVLKRSLTLQPTFPDALALLGRLEMEAGHREAAEAYLRPLMEAHPEIIANSHLRAGEAAEAKNDPVAAERHYREGLSLNPNSAELQANLGVLCLAQGRIAEAREPLEANYRLQPKNPQSCMLLGQIYAMLQRTEEAKRLLTEGANLADQTGNREVASHCREILQSL